MDTTHKSGKQSHDECIRAIQDIRQACKQGKRKPGRNELDALRDILGMARDERSESNE